MAHLSVTPRGSQGLHLSGRRSHEPWRRGSGRRTVLRLHPRPTSRCLPGAGGTPAPSSPRFRGSGGWAGARKTTAAELGGAPGRAHKPALGPEEAGGSRAAEGGRRRRLGPGARLPFLGSRRATALSPPRYLHGTTEEGARVGRQLFHVEVHDVHLGRQPSGAADGPSGEAAAPGRSGGGRRGGCMEAAPGPPPQLSFPRRRGQRVGRGARTGAQETAARPGGGCRDLSQFRWQRRANVRAGRGWQAEG